MVIISTLNGKTLFVQILMSSHWLLIDGKWDKCHNIRLTCSVEERYFYVISMLHCFCISFPNHQLPDTLFPSKWKPYAWLLGIFIWNLFTHVLLPNISYNRLSEKKVQNWGGTLSKVTNIYHWGVNKVPQFTFVPIHWWLRTFFWECIKRDFPDFIMSQITNTSQTLMSYFWLIHFFF